VKREICRISQNKRLLMRY